MPTFDAALGVLPVEAVVPLVVCTVQAWHRVRPPHDRGHQLTGRQVAGRLDDPSERLMADDQMVVTPRGLAVLSGDELVVGPVDADRQHVDERLIRPGCRVRDSTSRSLAFWPGVMTTARMTLLVPAAGTWRRETVTREAAALVVCR